MPDPVSPPAQLSTDQVADLAQLLTQHLAPGSVAWFARSVLGREEKEAANEVGDAAAYAQSIVELINRKGLIPDAIALLGQEAHRNSRLMFGVNHVLAGKRLDDNAAYQAFVNKYEPFFSTLTFQECLAGMQRRLCAIALGGPHNQIVGSGFLVGSDLVMTNYHVLETFLKISESGAIVADGPGDQIFCIFDYVSPPPPPVPLGQAKHASVVVAAAGDWLVGARRSLAHDGTAESSPTVKDEYDYAVIKLAEHVGTRPARLSGGALRGWLTLPERIDVLNPGRVFVFQHPGKAHQQWDVGEFVQLDRSSTRVWYSVSTAKGSSGGAAVDSEGNLFALHNAEVTCAAGEREVNQGVRIDLIAKDLASVAPAALAQAPPTAAPLAFWSLSDDIRDPRPIIGRAAFRDHVAKMSAPGGARLMVVTGAPNSGVQFSIKLLRRTLGAQTPIAIFKPEELQTFTPQRFIEALVNELGLLLAGAPPIPDPPASENIPRWLGLDLPRWLLARLSAQEERNRGRFPAWVVINTVMPAGERLFWANNLKDCVAALTGVQDVGHASTDLPQLRWLFLGSVPDGLPIAGVNRHEEELGNDGTLRQEVTECVELAWQSLGNQVKPLGAVGVSSIAAAAVLGAADSPKPIRKHLAAFVGNMIRNAVQQTGGGP